MFILFLLLVGRLVDSAPLLNSSIYQTIPLQGVDPDTASHVETLKALDTELEDLQRYCPPVLDYPVRHIRIDMLMSRLWSYGHRLQAARTESKLERDRLQRELRDWRLTLENTDDLLKDYAKVKLFSFVVFGCNGQLTFLSRYRRAARRFDPRLQIR